MMFRRLFAQRPPSPALLHAQRWMSSTKNYHQVLGVPRTATLQEIKSAYLALAKRHHPDLNQDNEEDATARFREVSEAWKYLAANPPTPASSSTAPPRYAQQQQQYDFDFTRQHYYSYYNSPFQSVNSFERFERLRTHFPEENINRFKKIVQRYLQGNTDRINNLQWAIRIISEALQAEQRKIKRTNAFNVRYANLCKLFPKHDVGKFRPDVEAYLKGKDPLRYDLHWAQLIVDRLLKSQPQKKRQYNNKTTADSKKKKQPKEEEEEEKPKSSKKKKRKRYDGPKQRPLFRYAYPGHFYEEF